MLATQVCLHENKLEAIRKALQEEQARVEAVLEEKRLLEATIMSVENVS